MVSVIIPARNERYLSHTIKEVYYKAHGDVETIVIEDQFMRTAINMGVAEARGKYIMKLDAHCMLDHGYDVKLVAEHHDNWIQIPRRKRLDEKTWTLKDKEIADIDYLSLDDDLMGIIWGNRRKARERKKILIDDIEAFQGSCYFMTKDYFHHLGLLDDKNFGGSGNEATEIMLKCWHDKGRLVRNKKTWYAHSRLGRLYSRDDCDVPKSRRYTKQLAREYGFSKS